MTMIATLGALLAFAALTGWTLRQRRLRTRPRHRSRYFSISLTTADPPKVPDDIAR